MDNSKKVSKKKKVKTLNSENDQKIRFSPVSFRALMKEGFVAGLAWSFGVTVGFVLISTVVVFILKQLGGLPIVGSWIADVVEETQNQLFRRNPLINR